MLLVPRELGSRAAASLSYPIRHQRASGHHYADAFQKERGVRCAMLLPGGLPYVRESTILVSFRLSNAM